MNIVNGISASWCSWVFDLGWQSGAVGLVLLGVAWSFRRLPAPFRYGLLVVALIKFAVPPVAGLPVTAPDWARVERPVVVARLFEAVEPAPAALATPSAQAAPVAREGGALMAAAVPARVIAAADDGRGLTWQSWLLLAHVGGALAVVAFMAHGLWRLRKLTRSCRLLDGGPLRARFDGLKTRLGVLGEVELLAMPESPSPMAFGILRRRVLIPQALLDKLSESQLDSILAHELAHHRRNDTWLILAENLLLVLWWFHPVFWLVLRGLRSAREDCCDDTLLHAGVADDETYCESLLRAAATVRSPGLGPAALGFADHFHPIARRLRRIMDVTIKRRPGLSAASIVGLVLLAVCVAPGVRMVAAEDAAAAPSTVAAADGVVFDGVYRHGSRGEQRTVVKREEDGSVTAVAEMFGGNTETARGTGGGGLTYYENKSGAYSIQMEFEPGKVIVTRRGIREDWDRKEFAVPADAFFDPNARPDSYVAAQVYSRILPTIAEGETRQFDVFDWDASGDAFGFYKISLTRGKPVLIDVPAGQFEVTDYTLQQQSDGRTWFKKRTGQVTSFQVLKDGTIVRIVRHREPYELQLMSVAVPAEMLGRLGPPAAVAPTTSMPAPPVPTADELKEILAAPAPEFFNQAPGELTLNALYRHKSRGGTIDVPEHRWAKYYPGDGNTLTVCSELPFMKQQCLAVCGPEGFRRYEVHSRAEDAGPGYQIVMEFEPGKVFVTRRGVREDWDRKEFQVPAGAVFDPNSRPDPYVALQIQESILDIPAGKPLEVEAYDWDSTGNAFAFYRMKATRVGVEEVTVPCGRFRAMHVVLEQLTSADTWFKKRAGLKTDVWYGGGVILRVIRHREPYEVELLDWQTPETLAGLIERTAPQPAMAPGQVERAPIAEDDRISGLWSPRGLTMPYDGVLYMTPVKGEAGGMTQLGVGTSLKECWWFFGGLPNHPQPSGEVKLGEYKKGELVPFCMMTTFGEQFFVSTSEDSDAAVVAFQDKDGSLKLDDGSILEQIAPDKFLLHLDDANSYRYDDDDNDIPVVIRLEKK